VEVSRRCQVTPSGKYPTDKHRLYLDRSQIAWILCLTYCDVRLNCWTKILTSDQDSLYVDIDRGEVLLTSVGNDPEVDDPCTSVQKLREARQPRRRAFRVPEPDSHATPAGAASGRRASAGTKDFSGLLGAAGTFFACLSIGFASAAPVAADPGAVAVAAADGSTNSVGDAGPPPPPADDGQVESTPLVTTKSPDGWTLTVSAKGETELPVASLTNEPATREYLVGGTFNGSLHAPAAAGTPHGTLEVGYQIACGADMSSTPGVNLHGDIGILTGVGVSVSLKPGIVNIIPVSKKEFKGSDPWVMISGYSIKIDGCIGQSFIRSYATLTRSTDTSDVILSYYGTTKAV
jgi:hypothetical protein